LGSITQGSLSVSPLSTITSSLLFSFASLFDAHFFLNRYPRDSLNPSPSETRSLSTPYTRLCNIHEGLCPSDWQEKLKEVKAQQPKNTPIAQRDIAYHRFVVEGRQRSPQSEEK
jgi:hypothetical protein